MTENKVGFTSQCHPEFNSGSRCLDSQSGEMPNQVWHDTSFGFTLIELLVVVLIIGILTSVALPQYQKAVLKSRYSAMMPIAKSLADGNEIYYMEHGNYAENPTELMVQGSAEYPDGTTILLYNGNGLSYVRASNTNVPKARYLVYQKHSENFADTTMCEAGDSRANALCQALGGKEVFGGNSSGESGWTAYLLSGSYGNMDTFGNSQADAGSTDTFNNNQTDAGSSVSGSCSGSKPKNITASKSGAKGKAVCVNGQWKYEWSGGTDYGANYADCDGETEFACAGASFEEGRCIGKVANACNGAIFDAYGGYCEGQAANACSDIVFSGPDASCYGNAANACAGSTFSGPDDGVRALCAGNVANGCGGTSILGGGSCYANVAGGCDGAKYGVAEKNNRELMGYCAGSFCPEGTPSRYDGTTWNGGYCNPSYMVSGNCPAGSPKQGDNCWDGNGNEVAC